MSLRAKIASFLGALDRYDAPGAASAMAFDAFFSLMPLLALIGWASHRLLSGEPKVLDAVLRLTPSAVARLADTQLMRLSSSGQAVLPPVSSLGFLWLASSGVATAMKEFERMFDAPPRSWLRRRALALGFVLAAMIAVALSTGFALIAALAGSAVAGLAAVLVPMLSLWLLVGVFFRLATARRAGARARGFSGALVTLGSWLVVSALFSIYVRQIANYSRFYGSLAAVAVVLVWLWLMSLALLVGGEMNARLEGVRR